MCPVTTKILICDDMAPIRENVRRVLRDLKYDNVLEADNGEKAFALLDSHSRSGDPVGFVISDWNMPVLTGIEFLRKVIDNVSRRCHLAKVGPRTPLSLSISQPSKAELASTTSALCLLLYRRFRGPLAPTSFLICSSLALKIPSSSADDISPPLFGGSDFKDLNWTHRKVL